MSAKRLARCFDRVRAEGPDQERGHLRPGHESGRSVGAVRVAAGHAESGDLGDIGRVPGVGVHVAEGDRVLGHLLHLELRRATAATTTTTTAAASSSITVRDGEL